MNYKFATTYGKGVLQGTGVVSREMADKKALAEYRTYQARTLSSVEMAYLESVGLADDELNQLKSLERQAKKASKK